MRYRDILLEFDLSKTRSIYGEKLLARFDRDRTAMNFRVIIDNGAMERVGEKYYLKKNAKAYQEAKQEVLIQQIVFSADPTPNKSYAVWIVTRYLNGGIRFFEDLSKTKEYLDRFDRIKKSGFFKRNPDVKGYADIGAFKTLSDLGDFVLSIPETDKSNAQRERDAEQALIDSGQAVILHNDAEWKVLSPKTQEAAVFFGRNTQWCTSATSSENYFKYYVKDGPLYIILNKPTNRRWQCHVESGQFMDERDQPVDWGVTPMALFDLMEGLLGKNPLGPISKFRDQPHLTAAILKMEAGPERDRLVNKIADLGTLITLYGALLDVHKDDDLRKNVLALIRSEYPRTENMSLTEVGSSRILSFSHPLAMWHFDLYKNEQSNIWATDLGRRMMKCWSPSDNYTCLWDQEYRSAKIIDPTYTVHWIEADFLTDDTVSYAEGMEYDPSKASGLKRSQEFGEWMDEKFGPETPWVNQLCKWSWWKRKG